MLIGRRGAGKSTILQQVQGELRDMEGMLCAYIDIKSLYADALNLLQPEFAKVIDEHFENPTHARRLVLGRAFIALTVDAVLEEIASRGSSLLQRLRGVDDEVARELRSLKTPGRYVENVDITFLTRFGIGDEEEEQEGAIGGAAAATIISRILGFATGILEGDVEHRKRARKIDSQQITMADFKFSSFTEDLKRILSMIGVSKLILIVDDFSELDNEGMKLFVTHVMRPLFMKDQDFVKFKVAAYPGRYDFGDIDPTRFDFVRIDPFYLYGDGQTPTEMEALAIEFMRKLLDKRVQHYTGRPTSDFLTAGNEAKQGAALQGPIWRLLYKISLGNARTLGSVLATALADRRGPTERITEKHLERAAKQYFEQKIEEPFRSRRIMNQRLGEEMPVSALEQLLGMIVAASKQKRAVPQTNKNLTSIVVSEGSIPTSHFHVRREFEDVLQTLEMNAFITKYKENNTAPPMTVYAVNYALCRRSGVLYASCEMPVLSNLLFDPLLNYSRLMQDFLRKACPLKCASAKCKFEVPDDERAAVIRRGMKCPECDERTVIYVQVSVPGIPDEPTGEGNVRPDVPVQDRLQEMDATIIRLIHAAGRPMTAAMIAEEMELRAITIGNRARVLRDRGLLAVANAPGKRQYCLTDRAKSTYFFH